MKKGEPHGPRLAELEEKVSKLELDARRQIEQLRTLNKIGRSIAAELDLARLLELACDLATKNLLCARASIMLAEGGELVMKASRGIPSDVASSARLKLGRGYAGKVAESGRSLLVTDDQKKPPGSGRAERVGESPGYSSPSFAIVPIVADAKILGVVNVTNKVEGSIEPGDLEFLEAMAAYLAVAIENARLHERAKHLAATDGLTELFNHRYFQERLIGEIERWRRYWVKGVALVMLDLDRFKRFNDSYGHRVGDDLLREIGRRLRAQARRVDVCCRYGGDEFAVILPEIDPPGALAFASRLRRAISGEPFWIRAGEAVDVTASIGVASCPEDELDAGELIEAADRALFRSKHAGRNVVTAAERMSHEGPRDPSDGGTE